MSFGMADKNRDQPLSSEKGSGSLQNQSGATFTWISTYNRYRSRAILLSELRLQGFIACLVQLVATLCLQGGWYATFYSLDDRLAYVPIPTMVFVALISCLGLMGLALLKSLLLGIHAVLGLALGAALSAYHTGVYMLLADGCDHNQSSFRGCDACACAAANTCTRDGMRVGACASCKAWPIDVCSKANGFLPYMGLLVLLLMAFPSVLSLLVLMRLEKANSELANRVTYARALVHRELERLHGGYCLGVAPRVLVHVMATLLRHGGRRDRDPVLRCCELLQLDPRVLQMECQEMEARSAGFKWLSISAPFSTSSAAPPASTGAAPPGAEGGPIAAAPLASSSPGPAGSTWPVSAVCEVQAPQPRGGLMMSTPTPGLGPGPGPELRELTGATGDPTFEAVNGTRQRSFLWHKMDLDSDAEQPNGMTGLKANGPWAGAPAAYGDEPQARVMAEGAKEEVEADLRNPKDEISFAPWKPPGSAAAGGSGSGKLAAGSPSPSSVSAAGLRRGQMLLGAEREAQQPGHGSNMPGSATPYGTDPMLPGKVTGGDDEAQLERTTEEAERPPLRHFKTPRSLMKARTTKQLL